jgi:CheY-like chemotaxis protein
MPPLPPPLPPPRRFPANMPPLPAAAREGPPPPPAGLPSPPPAPAAPVIAQPVIAEPEIAELEIAELEIAEPEIAEPEIAEPAIAEAVIVKPVIAKPVVLAPVPSANPGLDAKVVVLAEDDLETRQLLVQSLGREYRVFEAADGQAVLDLLARIARPAVVILDINMPHLDGLGVAAEIKQTPQLKDVPIIFLTCLDSATDVIKGIQAGARNYITKPFAISKLMDKVAKASGQST